MTNPEKQELAEKLEVAASLIQEVAGNLERKVGNCECCGGYQYENRGHWQMGTELDAMVRKCRGMASAFRTGHDGWKKERK